MVDEGGKVYALHPSLGIQFDEVGTCSLGFTILRGQQLHPGFQTYIGGKEVELDCQIPQSQFPGFRGEGGDEDLKPEPVSEPAKTAINAKSFYGISKPKTPGPL